MQSVPGTLLPEIFRINSNNFLGLSFSPFFFNQMKSHQYCATINMIRDFLQ